MGLAGTLTFFLRINMQIFLTVIFILFAAPSTACNFLTNKKTYWDGILVTCYAGKQIFNVGSELDDLGNITALTNSTDAMDTLKKICECQSEYLQNLVNCVEDYDVNTLSNDCLDKYQCKNTNFTCNPVKESSASNLFPLMMFGLLPFIALL